MPVWELKSICTMIWILWTYSEFLIALTISPISLLLFSFLVHIIGNQNILLHLQCHEWISPSLLFFPLLFEDDVNKVSMLLFVSHSLFTCLIGIILLLLKVTRANAVVLEETKSNTDLFLLSLKFFLGWHLWIDLVLNF